ncbi:MAG: hypothetical protein CL840_14995 [Crocinitomicaceae bacterium]|jgi:hypothetical protein|nr:hypothetical protein [Crocinitomicaceae bacterium]|tara:strand:+ start:138047 stop:138661 length:615 start_codon:yes stop_codon:yes gene_type:complete
MYNTAQMPPALFSLMALQVKAKEGSTAHVAVFVNTLDLSLSFEVECVAEVPMIGLFGRELPSYARNSARATVDKVIESAKITFGSGINKVDVSPATNVIDSLLDSCPQDEFRNSENWKLEPGERTIAYDSNETPIYGGETVICIDATEHGDSDSEFDLVENKVYIVDEVHDEENLLSPMILLKDSNSGPVFPNRFVVQSKGVGL